MIHSIYENGFPYLLIIPSYVAMTFAIIFPVLVTLLIAFTFMISNTLPQHAKLLDWVGFDKLATLESRSADSVYLGLHHTRLYVSTTLQIVI